MIDTSSRGIKLMKAESSDEENYEYEELLDFVIPIRR
jgi:hypothetical protein